MVLFLGGDYRGGYAVLLISAGLTIAALVIARRGFPLPAKLEEARTVRPRRFGRLHDRIGIGVVAA